MGNPFKGHGKAIVIGAVVIFGLAQLIRPARTNPPIVASRTIEASVKVPPAADAILKRSCGDCHSNATRWPWYNNVAPVMWLVSRDVNDGRRHMNFSDWPSSNVKRSDHLLEHICHEVTTGDMPLWFYLPMHPNARLSKDDVKTLCQWTTAARAQLAAPPAQAPKTAR